MGRTRVDLQDLLEGITPTVYFQPPSDQQMTYPCIVYQRYQSDTKFANNSPYRNTKRYQVTVISRDPDDVIPGKVANLPMCLFNRFFAVNSLNHDVYDLYFEEERVND